MRIFFIEIEKSFRVERLLKSSSGDSIIRIRNGIMDSSIDSFTEGMVRESLATTMRRGKGTIDITGIVKNRMCSQRWITSLRTSIPM